MSNRLLVEYIRTVLENASAQDQQLNDIINAYVANPDNLSGHDRVLLIKHVRSSQLKKPTRLERIERHVPDFYVGTTKELSLASFSLARFTENHRAGHIAWKTSDAAITVIDSATHGLQIDYNTITAMFDAASEREVLVSGRYICDQIEKIVEPGTYEPYGYKTSVYHLREF